MKLRAAHSRRTFIKTGIAGAVFMPSILRSGIAGAQGRKFTVMAVGGSWGTAIKELIGDPFAKANGAEIAYDQRPNAQQLAAIQAARGNPTVDVVELGSTRMGQAIALDLVERIDPAKVPNFAAVDPAYKNPFYADRYIAPWALTINTKVISKAEATQQGWSLLADKKLKGKVAIPKFGWMGEMWMHAANLSLGGSYDNFDPVVALCRKAIRENDGLVMESNDQGMQLLTSGEVAAAPFWVGRTYMLQDQKVAGIDFVYPKGWVAYGSGFMIVKGGPNTALAEKFVDQSLAPEVQVEIAKKFSYSATNTKAVPLIKDLPRLQISAEDQAKVQALDYEKMYKLSDKYLERVNREVVG
jgi:putative spermidine/putrescine transport system substrate-binding protein